MQKTKCMQSIEHISTWKVFSSKIVSLDVLENAFGIQLQKVKSELGLTYHITDSAIYCLTLNSIGCFRS